MSSIAALLWDVDGTIAETERDGHRVAFNRAFEEFGLPWRWDDERYGELLRIAGGRERLQSDLEQRREAPPRAQREALVSAQHARKNELYAQRVTQGGLPLRPGVRELMRECVERAIPMAIVTTTSRANIAALMRSHWGEQWHRGFGAVVGAEDVARKKPDPEVYLKALEELGVPAERALALEDSPSGVAAARAAGCPVIVTRSVYFARDPIEGALAVGPGLGTREGWQPALDAQPGAPVSEPTPGHGRVGLADLERWLARARASG